jgi:hypothetical protein
MSVAAHWILMPRVELATDTPAQYPTPFTPCQLFEIRTLCDQRDDPHNATPQTPAGGFGPTTIGKVGADVSKSTLIAAFIAGAPLVKMLSRARV